MSTRSTAPWKTLKTAEAAHQRDIRVIIELIVNHTSDQHPWFQRARRAPQGSPERDFYVWSDTYDRSTKKLGSFSKILKPLTGPGIGGQRLLTGTAFMPTSPT
jgi:hypothetical protein